jgi:ATP synthase protein I
MDRFTGMILRGAALPTAVAGVAVGLIALLASGSSALIGALAGTAVVIVFFLIGQFVLASVLRTNPQMAMPVAMALYVAKIGVLLVLLLLLRDTTLFDTKVFALAVLVCTLVWTVAEVVILARSKVLYVDPADVPPAVREAAAMRDPGANRRR